MLLPGVRGRTWGRLFVIKTLTHVHTRSEQPIWEVERFFISSSPHSRSNNFLQTCRRPQLQMKFNSHLTKVGGFIERMENLSQQSCKSRNQGAIFSLLWLCRVSKPLILPTLFKSYFFITFQSKKKTNLRSQNGFSETSSCSVMPHPLIQKLKVTSRELWNVKCCVRSCILAMTLICLLMFCAWLCLWETLRPSAVALCAGSVIVCTVFSQGARFWSILFVSMASLSTFWEHRFVCLLFWSWLCCFSL